MCAMTITLQDGNVHHTQERDIGAKTQGKEDWFPVVIFLK